MLTFTGFIMKAIGDFSNGNWFPQEGKFYLADPETLKKCNPDTEITVPHIFELDEHGRICTSCCGKFDAPSSIPRESDKILSASQMRFYLACLGKEVCGTCVSHLYSNKN